MLEEATRTEIVRVTDTCWEKHVKDPTFAALVTGKEPGHRMADYFVP